MLSIFTLYHVTLTIHSHRVLVFNTSAQISSGYDASTVITVKEMYTSFCTAFSNWYVWKQL